MESETLNDCNVFRVRREHSERSSDQKHADFYVIDSPNWVNVIALDVQENVVMVEQFRHGIGETILELPGGLIDKNEMPLEAARRELLEETGYTSEEWRLIGSSHPNPAIQSNTIFHFLALRCELTGTTSFDPNESLVPRLVASREISRLIQTGVVAHSLVVAAFAYYWGSLGNS